MQHLHVVTGTFALLLLQEKGSRKSPGGIQGTGRGQVRAYKPGPERGQVWEEELPPGRAAEEPLTRTRDTLEPGSRAGK